MITYDFYVMEYNGFVIPNIEQFNAVAHKATAFIDRMIMDRTNLEIDAINKKYYMAICSVADDLYKQGNSFGVASENVGKRSKSYFNSDERNKQLTNNAKYFLSNTGLLYRGLK